MRRHRLEWVLTPLVVLLAGGAALLTPHGRLLGQGSGSGSVTWSGRIRVDKTLTTKTQCTNCEFEVNDFASEAHYITEYQLERVPQRADSDWSSADVRVQVRGNYHSRSYGVNHKPDANTRESLIENQLDGSGVTVAGATIFLRRSGEEDDGHCRIEFGPIGQREDNGPLTQSIVLSGSEHMRFVYKDAPTHDVTKPDSDNVQPDGDRLDVPCGPKARSLRGDRVVDNESGRYVRVSWDLTQDGEAQTEVVLIPAKDYDQWQPQAGESESDLGDFIDVRVVAQERGKPGSKPPQKVAKYKIQLVDVSKEPGVCMNWPQAPSGAPGPDLKLDKENPYITLLDKDGQSAETKKEGLNEFMVTVNSHDWGAFGKLQVTAELKDGSTVQAHVENKPSEYALALPKDENTNHIADWWEHWFELKNTAPEADDDKTPLGEGHDGDTISLYEEYRGFRVQGKHERLSPEMKDVFIYDRDSLGLGYYGETGLQTHRVSRQELTRIAGDGNTWTVNGNHGSHSLGTAWALRLVRYAIGEGAVGETEGGPGVPSKIEEVRIDTVRIAVAAGPYADAELKSTIAHELGHATNIWHHGDGLDYAIAGDVLLRRKDGTTKNFVCASKDCFQAAVQHGAFSGDDRCIMRYDSTDFYEDPGGNCEWTVGRRKVRGRRYGYDPPGTIYCETRKGSGVNDTTKPPNKAGDTSPDRGECKYKFCVNSAKH
jgi:hypothetical protein